MYVTLTLPQLVAGRELAKASLLRLGALADREVVVDARQLASGTASFAGEMVHVALVQNQARSLTVVGGPADFQRFAADAARAERVEDRLRLTERLPSPVDA